MRVLELKFTLTLGKHLAAMAAARIWASVKTRREFPFSNVIQLIQQAV